MRARISQLDDELVEQQRMAYAVEGVDENESAMPGQKKRKQAHVNGEDVSAPQHTPCKASRLTGKIGRRWTREED